MQSSAQKARLCCLKYGLFFWLSSCRHLLQLFQRLKHASFAAAVSTHNIFNNKYYFISSLLHLVSGTANESWRLSAVEALWSMGNSCLGASASQAQSQGDGLEKEEEIYLVKKEGQEIIEKTILESWGYNFMCCVWTDLCECFQVKMNE